MESFGIKELYDITIKATSPLEFCGRKYQAGEVLTRIERAQFGTLAENVRKTTAHGGKEDRDQVLWRTPQPLLMQIEQGVVSKSQLSLLTNNFLEINQNVAIPYSENLRNVIGTDKIKVKYLPDLNYPLFLYTKEGDKLKPEQDFRLLKTDNNECYIQLVTTQNTEYFILDYYFNKSNQEILRIGKDAWHGFLKLEAKTRVKDDKDGYEKTGIFIIPKMRIMSDLSMQLGERATPFIYNFVIQGEPVGSQGDTRVCDLIFLNEDIDADTIV